MLNDRDEALLFLTSLGATPRLIHHANTVCDTASLLASSLQKLGVSSDRILIEIGAVLHDVGKIRHPEELSHPGRLHELAGEDLLLAHGLPSTVARFCKSHAQWDQPNVSFEERIVALADKLWKGKRESALELSVIDEAAAKTGLTRWDVFHSLDDTFESIAATGADKLERSRTY